MRKVNEFNLEYMKEVLNNSYKFFAYATNTEPKEEEEIVNKYKGHKKWQEPKFQEKEWVDNKGFAHSTKQRAQTASFINWLKAAFTTGFPYPVKYFWTNAQAVWPIIFIKQDRITIDLLNHERIHIRQQVELLVIGAYVWYFFEFIYRLIQHKNIKQAYLNISFEREARDKQTDHNYLLYRQKFAFKKYL